MTKLILPAALALLGLWYLRERARADRRTIGRAHPAKPQSLTYGSVRDAAGFAMAWDERDAA